MKIKHVHINAYKVFRDFDIDFCHDGNTLNLVVIIGTNGTGKTIILRDIISGNNLANIEGYIVVDDNGESKVITFPISPSDEAYREIFSKIIFYNTKDKNTISNLQKEIIQYVDNSVRVQGKTSFEAYLNIQTFIDNIFSDFDIQIRFKGINEDKQVIFTNLNNEEFGIEGLSSGEQLVLSKFFPFFINSMKGRVLLIDEPEESLHPDWQASYSSALRRYSQNNNCQFILATHSPQIIFATYKEEIRSFVRDEKGYILVEKCWESPYGWTVGKVLSEIQRVRYQRLPEIESRLAKLRDMVLQDLEKSDEFKIELAEMEALLGYSDSDLILIRMEAIRRNRIVKKRL